MDDKAIVNTLISLFNVDGHLEITISMTKFVTVNRSEMMKKAIP